jgi:hypothetical protein
MTTHRIKPIAPGPSGSGSSSTDPTIVALSTGTAEARMAAPDSG